MNNSKIRPVIFWITFVAVCLACTSIQVRICAFGATDTQCDDTRQLPCLMYHSVLKSKQGAYIVSPSQIESDLRALKNLGYVSVTTEQLTGFVDGENDLPQKPILITFDDGHYNNLYYAEQLLAKYQMHAVLNIVGCFSEYSTTSGDKDNPNYSHITWDEIAQMSDNGVFEAGNHTYNMHKYKPRFGIAQKVGESDSEYTQALVNDIGKLQQKLFELTNKECRIFAYPFGKYSSLSEATLSGMGFRITLTCNEGVSTIKRGHPESLHLIKRINRSGNYDTQTVLQKLKCKH